MYMENIHFIKFGVTICLAISSGLIHRQHTQETVTLLTAERQTRWVDHQHDDVSKGVNITVMVQSLKMRDDTWSPQL